MLRSPLRSRAARVRAAALRLELPPLHLETRTLRELQPAISSLAIPGFLGAGRPNGGFRVSFAVNQARHFPEAGHHSAKGEQQNSGSETPSSPLKAGLFHEVLRAGFLPAN